MKMKISKFFEKYGDRLVQVHEDDVETGDYMLFHPEERFIAVDYLGDEYDVVSVYEQVDSDEDVAIIDNSIEEHPFKVGYYIIKKQS